MPASVYISPDLAFRPILYYTLQLIAANKKTQFEYVSAASEAAVCIATEESDSIGLCARFYQYLTEKNFKGLRDLADGSWHFYSETGQPDLLASIFYLVNCLQEFDAERFDKWGRFPYTDSLQKKNNITSQNLVQQLINDFCRSITVLKPLTGQTNKSSVFLTHDIDTVYGARNEDGKYALTNFKWFNIPGLVYRHHVGTPDWMNMDRIAALEQKNGYSSAFYWLVHQDKLNSDYDIHSPIIQKQIAAVESAGCDVGLHKSLCKTTLSEEVKILNRSVTGQRYHFLSFHQPNVWQRLEESGIKIDTSLGFSEEMGYRNSYGMPYMPYDLNEQRVYNVLEVPMQIMDRTFFNQGLTPSQAGKRIIDWLDQNREDSVITINFHNNFFFDKLKYHGYHDIYETILRYLREENIKSMSHDQLLSAFYRPDFFNIEA